MNTTSKLSLTDPHTWLALLAAVAAVVVNVTGIDVSPYVQAASVLVAGVVYAALCISKHRYAAAELALTHTATAAVAAAPVTSLDSKVLEHASVIANSAATIAALTAPALAAATPPATASPAPAPQAAPSAPQAAPPVPAAPPASPAAPGPVQAPQS